MARRDNEIAADSGDVFVDLGFNDPDEHRLRVRLALRLNERIAKRRLRESKLTKLFKIPRQRITELKSYRLSRFPSARLRFFLSLVEGS